MEFIKLSRVKKQCNRQLLKKHSSYVINDSVISKENVREKMKAVAKAGNDIIIKRLNSLYKKFLCKFP